jgi:CBS domain containing-hemolysin-like protein
MLALALALLCVLANGFFVAAEFALAKVRPTALEAMANEGDGAAKRAFFITQRLDEYLSATQLGITLASLALGWLGEPAMEELLAPVFHWAGLTEATSEAVAVAVGFSIISALHIVIGELVPKSMAIQHPEAMAKRSAIFLRAFFLATYPALWVLNSTSTLTLKLLRLPAPDHAEGVLSLEELRLVIHRSFGEVDHKKRELLERVLHATDRPVRTAMVPRVDMEIVSLRDDHEALLKKVQRFGYSRFPVSPDGEPDHITGYVYAKDLLMIPRNRVAASIESLRRDILIIPESTSIGDALDVLQHGAVPMALVVDEYGGTRGIVTLDDLVRELIGTVRDELRTSPHFEVEHAQDGSLVVHGGASIDALPLEGASIPPIDGADTVSRYVLAALGRLPTPGDILQLGGWEALVEDVRMRRVHRVRFRKVAAPGAA